MACIHCLIAFALLLCGCGAWAYPASGGVGSEAQFVVKPLTNWRTSTSVACDDEHSRLANANPHWTSSSVAVQITKNPPYTTNSAGEVVGRCVITFSPGGGGPGSTGTQNRDLYGRMTPIPYFCPNGGELQGTACVCPDGEVDTGSACVEICSTLAGQAPNGLTCTRASCSFYSTNQLQDQACFNGCMVSGERDMSWKNSESDPQWAIRISDVSYTGGPCSVGPESPEPGKGDTPKQEDGLKPDNHGKCPGTVNGVELWVECGVTETNKKEEKNEQTQNPDGSVDSKSQDKTQQTQCKDGVCTTTTTTTTTSCTKATPEAAESCETTVTTGASSAGKGAYCQENPGDPQCGDQSAWGGTCAAGFECKGDAVMCATARAVWLEKCALIDGPATATAEQEAYTAAKAGGEGYELTSTTVGIGTDRFSSANALGVAGQCIADLGVVVWGFSLSLPLSAVCSHLEMLGVVMLAVAWLMAAVIVGKGVTA